MMRCQSDSCLVASIGLSHFSHLHNGGVHMRVHPSQLIEGCILLEDVKGKSGRPIMEEGTILTEELITVLDKFLIDSVDVSTKLHDGKAFVPKRKLEPNEKKSEHRMEIYLEPEENRSI